MRTSKGERTVKNWLNQLFRFFSEIKKDFWCLELEKVNQKHDGQRGTYANKIMDGLQFLIMTYYRTPKAGGGQDHWKTEFKGQSIQGIRKIIYQKY